MPHVMKFSDITGESKIEGFKDWIEINSWSWGVTHATSGVMGGGSSGGDATFNQIAVSKALDVATKTIMQRMASGKHFDKVEIVSVKTTGGAKPEEHIRLTLSEVFVTSLQSSSTYDGSGMPAEAITLSFKKFEIKYKPQTSKGNLGGTLEFKYDLEKKKEV